MPDGQVDSTTVLSPDERRAMERDVRHRYERAIMAYEDANRSSSSENFKQFSENSFAAESRRAFVTLDLIDKLDRGIITWSEFYEERRKVNKQTDYYILHLRKSLKVDMAPVLNDLSAGLKQTLSLY